MSTSARDSFAETLWLHYADQMNFGYIDKVTMPAWFYRIIGLEGLNHMANRFSEMIEAPVMIKKDDLAGIIWIKPKNLLNGRKVVSKYSRKPQALTKKDLQPPRPPNAFILYRQRHHPIIVAKNPDMHNNQISIILGKQWRNESAETKAEFALMAEDLKKQHLRDFPDYQYQPRKPSEKKRRMTRRKTELLNESLSQRAMERTSKDAKKTDISTEAEDATPSFEDIGVSNPFLTNDLFSVSDSLTNDEFFGPFGLNFEETGSGNAMFDLGNEFVNDGEFLSMIKEHNDNLVNFTSAFDAASAPVLFHETTEDAKNDENFYTNAIDLERLSLPTFTAEELVANEESIETAFTQLEEQLRQAAFDQASNHIQQAESERQETL